MTKIAIIGVGNLGGAIANGLLKSKFITANNLTMSRRNTGALEEYKKIGVEITSDNRKAIKNADLIVLSVKPFNCLDILKEIKKDLKKNQVIISPITGVWFADMEKIIGTQIPIVRAMPNTAIAIQESLTAICCNDAVTEGQKNLVKKIFDQLGVSVFIEEKLMDSATVLGACGIAYALRFIRANIQGGIEIGFDSQTANIIANQTIKGAAELLIQTKNHPEQEIDKVTTPKGCTIAGINEMEHQGFSSSLIKGIITSYKKITG